MKYRIIRRVVVVGVLVALFTVLTIPLGGLSPSIAFAQETEVWTKQIHTLRPHPQSTPDNTVKVEPGIVSVANNIKVEYAGGNSPTFPVIGAAGSDILPHLKVGASRDEVI